MNQVANRLNFSSEQLERLSDAFVRVQRAWGRESDRDRVRFGARGMRGEFPALAGDVDELFARAGATVSMRYKVPQRRGGPSDVLLLSGTLGEGVVFMANAKPAGEGKVDFEITLYPAPVTDAAAASDTAPAEFLFRVFSDLAGDGIAQPELFAQFVSLWLHTPGVNRRKLLAEVSSLVTEELALLA
jgi:hypothetical protein